MWHTGIHRNYNSLANVEVLEPGISDQSTLVFFVVNDENVGEGE